MGSSIAIRSVRRAASLINFCSKTYWLTARRLPSLPRTKRHGNYAYMQVYSCATDRSAVPRASGEPGNRDSLKSRVIRAAAGTDRGRKASPESQTAVLAAVAALEQANPTPDPASSPLLHGTWSLLYQGPEVVKQEQRGEALEGPFLAFLGLLFGWAFRTQGISQIIGANDGTIQNLAEFKCLLVVPGSLNIVGTVTPTAKPSTSSESVSSMESSTRVDVAFSYALLQLGWLKLRLPLAWAKPKGWVETTYLDETFRIGHGDKGSIFVTARRK